MPLLSIVLNRKVTFAEFSKCVRAWEVLAATKIQYRRYFSIIQPKSIGKLLFLAFELWAGRTKANLRLKGAQFSVVLNRRKNCLALFLEWASYTRAATRRRRPRHSMKPKRQGCILGHTFTAWVLMMAHACHASIRSVENMQRLCGATGRSFKCQR